MIRALARLADGSVRRDIPCGDIAALRADPRVILWVDCTPDGVGEEQEERTLLEQFGFHPLAVDDALRETNIPKVDDWHDYIYVVLHAVRFESNIAAISAHELDLFVGRNFLVSHHTEPIPPLEQIWKSVGSEPRRLAGGCDNLLYQIADSIVADYMPLVDGIDDWIDQVEDEVFEKPSPETLARIFHQKRTLVNLRRSLGGVREVLNRLARDEYAVIDKQDRIYFRDVYDHVVRLYEIVESLRDLVGGSLDTYLSVTSNRTNEIMKTLTIVTVFFMPISFLTSFFGMNFFGEEYAVHPGHLSPLFWGTLAGIIVVPPLMYLWMRMRRWL